MAALLTLAVLGAVALARGYRSGWVHRSAATVRHRAAGHAAPEPAPVTNAAVEPARLRLWRHAVERATSWSAEHRDYAIIVDKASYTISVLKDGAEIAAWPVELGPDPVNDKQRQGDLCTPEGLYRITWRRELGQTSFYKALLIDYPNAQDRRHGRTGSHIEIHGKGSGKRPGEGGHNWTLGCIAMSNADIDALFALHDGAKCIRERTLVAIVGARQAMILPNSEGSSAGGG
jgi:hypothetical protein